MDITYGTRQNRIYLIFYPDEHHLYREVMHMLRFHIDGKRANKKKEYLQKLTALDLEKNQKVYIILGPSEGDVLLGVRMIHYLIGKDLQGKNRAYHLKKAFIRHIYPNIKDAIERMNTVTRESIAPAVLH